MDYPIFKGLHNSGWKYGHLIITPDEKILIKDRSDEIIYEVDPISVGRSIEEDESSFETGIRYINDIMRIPVEWIFEGGSISVNEDCEEYEPLTSEGQTNEYDF